MTQSEIIARLAYKLQQEFFHELFYLSRDQITETLTRILIDDQIKLSLTDKK